MSPSGQEVQTIAGTWVWAGDDCDAARGAEFTAPRRGRSGERTDIPSLVRAKGWRYQEWPDALDKAAAMARLPVASAVARSPGPSRKRSRRPGAA